MLRKSVIMMAVATAFTINVSAVQIEVPAGQPPMPGADASIPANTYENYRHINEVAEQKAESFSQFIKSKPTNPPSSFEKLNSEHPGLNCTPKIGHNFWRCSFLCQNTQKKLKKKLLLFSKKN